MVPKFHKFARRSKLKTWCTEVRTKGIRLDFYLSRTNLPWSRSRIKKKINNHEILVNGKISKPSYKVKKGDIIQTTYSPPQPLRIEPEPIPLSIIYEDDDIIVINKQAGIVVHPAKGHPNGTLVNALLYHCQELANGFGLDRPGVVHRLDGDTTGVIIFAKSERAHSKLAIQFQEREVAKIYLAVVWGIPPIKEGKINAPLGRNPIKRKLMAVTPLKSKVSLTRFEVLHSYPFASFLKVMPETGRTHQIRVHLSHFGYPIIGDPQYGGRDQKILRKVGLEYREEFNKIMQIINRQALHAASLEITHPVKNKRMCFKAPLYSDMESLLGFLNEVDNR